MCQTGARPSHDRRYEEFALAVGVSPRRVGEELDPVLLAVHGNIEIERHRHRSAGFSDLSEIRVVQQVVWPDVTVPNVVRGVAVQEVVDPGHQVVPDVIADHSAGRVRAVSVEQQAVGLTGDAVALAWSCTSDERATRPVERNDPEARNDRSGTAAQQTDVVALNDRVRGAWPIESDACIGVAGDHVAITRQRRTDAGLGATQVSNVHANGVSGHSRSVSANAQVVADNAHAIRSVDLDPGTRHPHHRKTTYDGVRSIRSEHKSGAVRRQRRAIDLNREGAVHQSGEARRVRNVSWLG